MGRQGLDPGAGAALVTSRKAALLASRASGRSMAPRRHSGGSSGAPRCGHCSARHAPAGCYSCPDVVACTETPSARCPRAWHRGGPRSFKGRRTMGVGCDVVSVASLSDRQPAVRASSRRRRIYWLASATRAWRSPGAACPDDAPPALELAVTGKASQRQVVQPIATPPGRCDRFPTACSRPPMPADHGRSTRIESRPGNRCRAGPVPTFQSPSPCARRHRHVRGTTRDAVEPGQSRLLQSRSSLSSAA